VEDDLSFRRLKKSKNSSTQSALAAAALAYNAEGFSLVYSKIHAVDGFHDSMLSQECVLRLSGASVEVLLQSLNFEQRFRQALISPAS